MGTGPLILGVWLPFPQHVSQSAYVHPPTGSQHFSPGKFWRPGLLFICERMSVSSTQPRSPTPERHQPRMSFQVPNSGKPMQRDGSPQPYFRGGRGPRGQSRYYNTGPGRHFNRQGSGIQMTSSCDRCGHFHAVNRCPATNMSCFNCGRMGHLRAKCRTARRGATNISG